MFYGFVCIAYVNICPQEMASSIFSSSFIGVLMSICQQNIPIVTQFMIKTLYKSNELR